MSERCSTCLTYEDRIPFLLNPCAKKLFQCMIAKQTNLAIAADLTRASDLLKLADSLGPHICLFKTHVDILEDFSWAVIEELKQISEKHQFLLFEDRKFADIGNTVRLQYEKGIYRIVEWADVVNAHIIPGPGIIEGLKLAGLPRKRGLLLLAQMSSKGSLAHGSYTERCLEMAQNHPDFVIGFISQEKLSDHPSWVYLTPGIQRAQKGDQLGQQYHTPAQAMAKGTDVIIVGRGIYEASDPVLEAKVYQQEGWDAYLKRIS